MAGDGEGKTSESEITSNLKECFKECAAGRQRLRECVVKSMDAGLSKDDVLAVIHERGAAVSQDDASLCSIVAIGQAFRHQPNSTGGVSADEEDPRETLRKCLQECGAAREHLRECVRCALDAGFSRQEILALTDQIVGGVGKDDVSLCGIIAADQVLRYEEAVRKEPLDIVKEREMEAGGA